MTMMIMKNEVAGPWEIVVGGFLEIEDVSTSGSFVIEGM